jgi:DNA-binding NarL/FixJ family response regulator
MSRVLVVDDSALARHEIGKILSGIPSIEIHTAVDGEEGVEKTNSLNPDLVVTDMIMPKLNGMELVEKLSQLHPSLPVVLVTSKGNEEIASKALSLGAASYVPKRLLNDYLLETAQNLLAITEKKRDDARLLDHLSRGEFSFVLGNDRTLVAPLIAYLQENIACIVRSEHPDEMRIGVALDEALTNAIYHGNLELSSELRESGGNAFLELAEERKDVMPYKNRRVTVDAKIARGEVRVTIKDEGPGFDPSSLPDPRENLDKVSGRGVMLMRVFMDEVTYNQFGNEVTLIKRW